MGFPSGTDERDLLESHIRRLDTAELVAFVADLWTARGFETDVDGPRVTAMSSHGRVVVHVVDTATDGVSSPTDADVLMDITGGSHEGIKTLDASDLAEQMWFAVDRSTARELSCQHLEAELEELTPPLGDRLWRWATVSNTPTLVVVVGLVVVTAVGGVVVALDVLPGPEDGAASRSAAIETPAGQPGDEQVTSRVDLDKTNLPPGVSAEGVTDIEALSDAHGAVLANQSYSLERNTYSSVLRDQEIVDIRWRVATLVEGDTYRIETSRTLDGDEAGIGSVYHDGNNTYVADMTEETPSYHSDVDDAHFRVSTTPPANVTDRIVETRLSTPTTTVTGTVERDGETLYRLEGNGQPDWPGIGSVRNYTVVALVRGDGLVRAVRAEYTVIDGDRLLTIERHFRYVGLGETTVDPPQWYQRRFAETDAT